MTVASDLDRQPALAFAETPPGRPRRRLPPAGLVLAWIILGVALVAAVAPDLLTAQSGTEGIASARRLPPGPGHWLGTDELGRDVWARIVHGAVHSLSGGAVAVLVGLVVGTLIGIVAGSAGRRTDAVLMRFVDVLISVPQLFLSLSIIIILGFGTVNAAIAVGAASVGSFARLARSEVVRVRRSPYVEAAFGSGGRFWPVLARHVLPNATTAVVAYSALQFGHAILQISTLGFLGYGAPPPTPEWGLMIAEGRKYLATAWWMTTFPGVAVVLTVIAANRVSHALKGRGR